MAKKKPETKAELLAAIKAVEDDPKSSSLRGFNKYTPAAQRKLDRLRRSVASIMRAERLARGEAVDDAGYSGRQSNRR